MKTEIFSSMIKYLFLFLFFISFNKHAKSQDDPAWMLQAWRTEQYPLNVFITGFSQDGKNSTETLADATKRIKDMARAELSESILASIQSVSDNYSQSISIGDSEIIKEEFKSETKITTDLEINGIRVESYVKNNIVYGFAYANKYEIIGYNKANLNMQVQQIEGLISTANELEQKREKKKAKDEFNKTLPIFTEITKSQGILSAVDKNVNDETLQMQKTMQLYNVVMQAKARLSQGIIVYMTTNELIFSNETNDLENGLKANLSINGCSFTTIEEDADWKIFISSKAREYNHSNKVYFSYVDAEIQLFKAPSDKHVYQEEISEKGGHSLSYKAAAKKAYSQIGETISKKVLTWINN